MATKTKENLVKLKCTECGRVNHYTKRNKKKIKEKLELSKYCNQCQKNVKHKEAK